MSIRRGGLPLLLAVCLAACGGSASDNVEHPSAKRVPVEPVEIEVDAQRAGQSMVVTVHGLGRGFRSGGAIESPDAWQVAASAGGSALRKVLSGPVKVSRDPAGSAHNDQWNVSVRFTVAFAVPPHIDQVRVAVTAPDGERVERDIRLTADQRAAFMSATK